MPSAFSSLTKQRSNIPTIVLPVTPYNCKASVKYHDYSYGSELNRKQSGYISVLYYPYSA